MLIDVVHLPRDLQEHHLRDRTVVVFDVLRATTSMIAALDAGAKEIRIFPTLESAREAASGFANARVLCGEDRCVRPKDFDLGNSPREFTRDRIENKTLFMSTTNGTRAIVAAIAAKNLLIGALLNASAIVKSLVNLQQDVTLLCAGTAGAFSVEDSIGAGAVIDRLMELTKVTFGNDESLAALHTFRDARENLPAVLRQTAGGRNIVAANLEPDIDFAARVDAIPIVGRVLRDPLRVVRGDRS